MTEAWDPSLSTTLRSPIVSTLPSSLLVMNSQTPRSGMRINPVKTYAKWSSCGAWAIEGAGIVPDDTYFPLRISFTHEKTPS